MSDATWTVKRVMDLAPDASSAQAARGCSNASKWVTLGRTELAVWGEFQGSGSKPYQTQVDLREPAFKCSCPSRKFPCKHGLGIMLVLAEKAGSIPVKDAPPAWVADWMKGREARAQKREEKAAAVASGEQPQEPVDAEAQAKRVAAREAKIQAGLEELSAFLRDVLRQGLAAVQSKPGAFFEKPAARLIDAQASGLARLVRELADIASSGDGWQSRMLAEIGRLHLIVQANRKIGVLSPGAQAELRSVVGWTVNQDELLGKEGVKGRWSVAAQTIDQEKHLITQKTWLIDGDSGRAAMVLNFAAGGAPLDRSLMVGTEFMGEVVYFPAATELRAIVKSRTASPVSVRNIKGCSVTEALETYARALSQSPWLGSQWPMALEAVVPVMHGEGRWVLQDSEGAGVAIDRRFGKTWELRSLSGGQGIQVFGEWNGQELFPMAAMIAGGQFVRLVTSEPGSAAAA